MENQRKKRKGGKGNTPKSAKVEDGDDMVEDFVLSDEGSEEGEEYEMKDEDESEEEMDVELEDE